jgi:hypothetical protein
MIDAQALEPLMALANRAYATLLVQHSLIIVF